MTKYALTAPYGSKILKLSPALAAETLSMPLSIPLTSRVDDTPV